MHTRSPLDVTFNMHAVYAAPNESHSYYTLCVLSYKMFTHVYMCTHTQAYFFEDDSDEQSGSDVSPLVRRPPSQSVSNAPHSHILTGYLSVVELLVLVS